VAVVVGSKLQKVVVAAGDGVPLHPAVDDVSDVAAGVDQGVVPPAEQGGVVQIGGPAVDPMDQVVRFCVSGWAGQERLRAALSCSANVQVRSAVQRNIPD
jgi:hypothetical protein